MIPVVSELMASKGEIVVLIKPQFEAPREFVKEGGIVDDPEVHQDVIEKITQGMSHSSHPLFTGLPSGIVDEGFESMGVIPSPLKVSTM